MRTERANAKINLYLDVVSKRENGYHDLISIMQTVSLCDLVTVDFRPDSHTVISIEASGNDSMPTDRRNLAYRAAELFLSSIGKQGEVRIFIEKHIPMAAGLAGGSSDAAAVFRALNHLCGKPLTLDQLCDLGSRLGADIPFCIVGGMSLVTGVGEKLEELAPMANCPLVVACMGEGVSTVWAYGKLDEKYKNFAALKEPTDVPNILAQRLEAGIFSQAAPLFFNLFEDVVPKEQPYVDRLKDTMVKEGAIRSMMSGSGPSVFGVFSELSDAERACECLRGMGAAAFVCHPCPKYSV